MGNPTGTRHSQHTNKPNKVICSCCGCDLTGFTSYEYDADSGIRLVCYIDASIISRAQRGELDLNDKAARKKYSPGRFELVQIFLNPKRGDIPVRLRSGRATTDSDYKGVHNQDMN